MLVRCSGLSAATLHVLSTVSALVRRVSSAFLMLEAGKDIALRTTKSDPYAELDAKSSLIGQIQPEEAVARMSFRYRAVRST